MSRVNLKLSTVSWINRNLKIIDKDSRIVSLHPNIGQMMLQNTIELQKKRDLPVRIVLLKPRQVGWSTWAQALGFEYANRHVNVTVQAVSADAEATNHIFRMSKLFQEEMPEGLKLATDASNKKEIVYASPHRSRIITQTAGKDALGIGATVRFFHGSECAIWPTASESISEALQQIPNKPDTYVILESTGHGIGGAFYDMFWEAMERRRRDAENYGGYLPVFFPWWKFREYAVSVSENFAPDEKERWLKKTYKLTDEQIMFRRAKLQEFRGDESKFSEQYPATPEEAFQSSGNPVFSFDVIDWQSSRLNKKMENVLFRKTAAGKVLPETVERSFNCWQLAYWPIVDHQYSMGIDTMEGRISDASDDKSSLDFHGVAILDRNAARYCCIYKGRGNQQELGEQCLFAAEFYNNAFVAPEIPNGLVVLNVFKQAGYQNIYNRQVHDDQYVEKDSETLGWRTTSVTRKWLVENLLVALQNENALLMNFEDIVSEMRSFVRNKEGKAIHAPGKHDDLLFASMIALQVHLRCPMENIGYRFGATGIYEFDESKPQLSLSSIGVVDEGIGDEQLSDIIFERTI